MSGMDNLQIGEIKKKKEDMNKTRGINTRKAVFQTGEDNQENDNPYAMSSRVEQLANYGPLMSSRIHTQNPLDLAFGGRRKKEKAAHTGQQSDLPHVKSEEKTDFIKAQPDLKVFAGDVMEKGVFTPKAKEAARHFFKQLTDWAGSFDDDGTGFYRELGIGGVLDCLYVDGMRLRSYLKEQYYYKTTGEPAQDTESLRNYVALIAARGDHVITLVRPNVKGGEAGVEYRNLYMEMSSVGEAQDDKADSLKEKGNHVRSSLKNRLDEDMTERVGRAYRKAYGQESDGFRRLEDAKDGLPVSGDTGSDEYKDFQKSLGVYSRGMQKLGLKPGRDDINLPVAEELKRRCEEAIRAAESYLGSNPADPETIKAVENAKKALETDRTLLDKAVNERLVEEGARMRLDEMMDSRTPVRNDLPDRDDQGAPDDADGDGDD